MQFTNCKISITGDLGSGKSTVAKIMEKGMPFEYLSTGKVQRKLALEMGLTTLELNRLADKDPSIDEKIDALFMEIIDDGFNYIVDSRLAWFFLPNSFKVYLQTDIHTAAERIMKDKSRKTESYETTLDAANKILARKKSENERFLKKYQADCANMSNYDLIIDTTDLSPTEVAKLMIAQLKAHLAGTKINQKWYAPQTLYPTKSITHLDNVRLENIDKRMSTNGFDEKHRVEIVKQDGCYWIYKGHEQTSAAIKNNIPAIPVLLLEEQLLSPDFSFEQNLLNNWELEHKFTFKRYPLNIS